MSRGLQLVARRTHIGTGVEDVFTCEGLLGVEITHLSVMNTTGGTIDVDVHIVETAGASYTFNNEWRRNVDVPANDDLEIYQAPAPGVGIYVPPGGRIGVRAALDCVTYIWGIPDRADARSEV